MLHLEGNITDHEQGQDGIVADRVIPVLKSLIDMNHIKTVVLYINSPGGSAMASDRIAREVDRLRHNKNVIALMGNIAASGGYYIASAANRIIASSHTITGSIGVVGGKLVLGKALEEYGVQSHSIAATSDTGFLDWWSPFSEDQRRRFRSSLERTYERFCTVVSKGRTMPLRAVYEVAQGRVWTGQQALTNGLVDQVGGMEALLQQLEKEHRIPRSGLRLTHYRFNTSGWRRWKKYVGAFSNTDLTDLVFASAPSMVKMIQTNPNEPLAICPLETDWQ